MKPDYVVGDLVVSNTERSPLGITALVDISGDVFGLEMNQDGLVPKIVGQFGRDDVGVVVEIDEENFMTRVVTRRGLVGWGNTWDFIRIEE